MQLSIVQSDASTLRSVKARAHFLGSDPNQPASVGMKMNNYEVSQNKAKG